MCNFCSNFAARFVIGIQIGYNKDGEYSNFGNRIKLR